MRFSQVKEELVSRALWLNSSLDLLQDPQTKRDCRQNLATAIYRIESAGCIQDLEPAIQMIQTYEKVLVEVHGSDSFSLLQLLLLPVLLFWELLKAVIDLLRVVLGLLFVKDALKMIWKRDSDAVFKAYVGKRLLRK